MEQITFAQLDQQRKTSDMPSFAGFSCICHLLSLVRKNFCATNAGNFKEMKNLEQPLNLSIFYWKSSFRRFVRTKNPVFISNFSLQLF
jgi:hypothetical protein